MPNDNAITSSRCFFPINRKTATSRNSVCRSRSREKANRHHRGQTAAAYAVGHPLCFWRVFPLKKNNQSRKRKRGGRKTPHPFFAASEYSRKLRRNCSRMGRAPALIRPRPMIARPFMPVVFQNSGSDYTKFTHDHPPIYAIRRLLNQQGRHRQASPISRMPT